MKNLNRMVKLFSDWSSTQDYNTKKKVKSILEDSTKNSSSIVKVYSEMGSDGEKMKTLFEESWKDIDENKTLAKRALAASLLKEDYSSDTPPINKDGGVVSEFGQSYFPIADMKGTTYDTNAMQSSISDGDRDILIQIRNAILSGSYTIAEALILNFWGRLSIKERVDILSWAANIGNYNSLVDVPQSRGMNFKSVKEKIEKKEITKEEYKDIFIRTAKEKMKAE